MRALIALLAVAIAALAIYSVTGTGTEQRRQEAAAPNSSDVVQPQQEESGTDLQGRDDGGDREVVPQPKPAQPETMKPTRTTITEWGNTLRGRVVDAGGQAVGGAKLTLTLYGPGSFIAPSEEDRINVNITADKEGSFSFKNLHPDKEYTIIAYRSDVGRKVEANLTVAKDSIEELEIVLEAGSKLFGTVLDSGGVAIEGAQLSLGYMALGGEDTAGKLVALSDAGGGYAFENISEGIYDLTAVMDGFGSATHRNLSVSGNDPMQQDVVLDVAYLIEGIVSATDGTPIEGAIVEAHGKRGAEGAATRSSSKSDVDGRFSFSDIPRGNYNLVARAPGYRASTTRRVATGELNVDMRMEAEPSISGRVLDPAGAPLEDFTVQLRRRMANSKDTIPVPRQRFKVTGSEDGAYLLSCPNKGDYVVEASNPLFAPSFSVQVTIGDGERLENINITMTAGGVIRGRIVDAKGPVAGARVGTYHTDFVVGDPFFAAMKFPGDATESEVVSAADGSFEVPTLSPCEYQIHIISNAHAPLTRRRIQITEGGEVDLGDVTLSSGGQLVGTVTGPDGASMSGVVIVLVLDAQAVGDKYGANYSARTGSDGTYEFKALPPGPYQVYAQRRQGGDVLSNVDDVQKTRRQVAVADGGTTTEDFQLD